MSIARWPITLLHRIALLAMLLPFFAVSALPSGVMPGRSEAGTLTLVLCTADGPREMQLDLGTGKAPTERQTCPWAILNTTAALPDAAASTSPPATLVAVDPVPETAPVRIGTLTEVPQARAPPALV